MDMWQLTDEERAERERMILQNIQQQALQQQANQAMNGMQQRALGELSKALARNSDVTAAEIAIAQQVPHEKRIGNKCKVFREQPPHLKRAPRFR